MVPALVLNGLCLLVVKAPGSLTGHPPAGASRDAQKTCRRLTSRLRS